jgi:hypothetical protein
MVTCWWQIVGHSGSVCGRDDSNDERLVTDYCSNGDVDGRLWFKVGTFY